MTAFPCSNLYNKGRFLSGCAFCFQHFQHFVGGGGGGVLLEIAGNDKDRVSHADFRHAIRAAGAAVILWGVGHIGSFLRKRPRRFWKGRG